MTCFVKIHVCFQSMWTRHCADNQTSGDIRLMRVCICVCVCVCRFGGEGSTDRDLPAAGGGVVWFGRLLVPMCRLELRRNH